MFFGLVACSVPATNSIQIILNEGVDTVGINEEHIDAGAVAQFGFKLLELEIVENNVNTSVLGTYQIVYHATYLEYEKTVIRYVTVVDDIPPVITINAGIDTIYTGTTWIDAGVEATDNSGGIVIVTVTGFVNNIVPNEYRIIYRAIDESGNQSVTYRYVNVIAND